MDSANKGGGGGSSNSNGGKRKKKRKNQRAVNGMLADVADTSGGTANLDQSPSGSASAGAGGGKWKYGISAKARSLMNLHNNEAGRRVSFCIHHKKIRKQIKSNIEKFVW